MKINSVLFAGAGAVGLSIAETVYRSAPDCISILAKGERLERYRKNGLRVNGEKLDQVIEDIRPSVGKDTIILSLLNGISSEEIIGRKLGRERLPLAMVLGTDASHEGEETIYTQKGTIYFGDEKGNNGEREEMVADFFTRTKVAFSLEPNMKRKLWFKYMFNVGANQTTAVLKLPYAAIMNKGGSNEIPEARHLFEKAMTEVIAVANAEGIDLNEGDIETLYKTVNNFNPTGFTSMCQDVLAGRKTEVEMFSLHLMELAKRHNISVPVNETLYLQLRTIEAGRFAYLS